MNKRNVIGAVYQISNGQNNSVLIYSVLKDGTLQYANSVDTGGSGTSLNMSDPLFSQNPIAVYNNNLFVVNPGSNTLSIFSIDPTNPCQYQIIECC